MNIIFEGNLQGNSLIYISWLISTQMLLSVSELIYWRAVSATFKTYLMFWSERSACASGWRCTCWWRTLWPLLTPLFPLLSPSLNFLPQGVDRKKIFCALFRVKLDEKCRTFFGGKHPPPAALLEKWSENFDLKQR